MSEPATEIRGRPTGSTKERIVQEALQLFARQGYSATTIAQIEREAGLAPGSGSLYSHFSSKRDVLEAVVGDASRHVDSTYAALTYLPGRALSTQLLLIGKATMMVLDGQESLVRFVLRDFEQFPDLLASLRALTIDRAYDQLLQWLRQVDPNSSVNDLEIAVAVGLGSLTNYWVLHRMLDTAPLGVAEERFLRGWARLVARMVAPG